MAACTAVCALRSAMNQALVHRATPPSSCTNSFIKSSDPECRRSGDGKYGWMVKFIMQFVHKVVLYLCLCKVTTSTTAFTADRAAGNSPKKWLSYWKNSAAQDLHLAATLRAGGAILEGCRDAFWSPTTNIFDLHFLSTWMKHECKSMVMLIFGLWCDHEGICSHSECVAGLLN